MKTQKFKRLVRKSLEGENAMKQRKWSGVKVKKELDNVSKSERFEIIANIATFMCVIVLGIFIVIALLWMIGGAE